LRRDAAVSAEKPELGLSPPPRIQGDFCRAIIGRAKQETRAAGAPVENAM